MGRWLITLALGTALTACAELDQLARQEMVQGTLNQYLTDEGVDFQVAPTLTTPTETDSSLRREATVPVNAVEERRPSEAPPGRTDTQTGTGRLGITTQRLD